MRILIVDDDAVNRRLLTRVLGRHGHQTVEAADGAAAWQLLLHDAHSLVISDWMMPGLDGPELCRRIRAAGFPHYTYFILLTARGEASALVEGMQAGADDFLAKPFDPDELDVRVRAGERVVALERELAERNLHLAQAYRVMQQDLAAAARMQRALLPEPGTGLPGLELAWSFVPCAGLAGDIFNFFALDERHVGFYLLDVAGHGIPAAMLSFSLSKLLLPGPQPGSPLLERSAAAPGGSARPPEQVVAELNQRFQDQSASGKHFTIIYGVLDLAAGRLRFCQAGQPAPLHRHGAQLEPVGNGGFPVGLLPEMDYASETIDFVPGDRLYLYSDGVTECTGSDSRQQFSSERLLRTLGCDPRSPLAEQVQRVEDALRTWRGQRGFEDDVTFVAIERQGNPEEQ